MSKWLIAFDLDDSLLMNDGTIDQELKKKLTQLQKNGNVLLFASGRSDHSIMSIVKSIGLNEEDVYISAFNGALLKLGEEEIFSEKLKTNNIKEVIEFLYKNNLYVQSYFKEFIVYEQENEYTNIEQSITGQQKKKVNSIESLTSTYPKLMGLGHPTVIKRVFENLPEILNEKYNITITKPYFLEVMNKGISKAKSIELLIKSEGINEDKTMAFGDSYNDIQMLKAVNISVAMDNSIKEVKDVCKYGTSSNNENGVLKFLVNFKDWS